MAIERLAGLPTPRVDVERLGLSELASTAATGVLLGAQQVIYVHGRPLDDLKVEFKVDKGVNTPKTIADTSSGNVIKSYIRSRHPEHRINEEESGESGGEDSGLKWHVDPLDGTLSFTRRQEYSTIAAALCNDEDRPLIAAVCHPFERKLYVAGAENGAFRLSLNEDMTVNTAILPVKLQVSPYPLDKASIVYVDGIFNGNTDVRKLEFMRAMAQRLNSDHHANFRMTGSNIDQQRHVAEGEAEATITDCVGGFFDLIAGGLLIQEAGGMFTDIYGNPVRDKSTQIAIGSNGVMHEELLALARDFYGDFKGFDYKSDKL